MTTVRFASLPSSSRLYFALIIRSRVATAKGIWDFDRYSRRRGSADGDVLVKGFARGPRR